MSENSLFEWNNSNCIICGRKKKKKMLDLETLEEYYVCEQCFKF